MYHSQVNYDSMKALSLINTIKYNVMDLPLGGSKGGISCDPKTLTNFELERITRKYAIELAKQQMIGAAVDFYVILTLKINSSVTRYRKWRTGNQLDQRYLSRILRSRRSQLPCLLWRKNSGILSFYSKLELRRSRKSYQIQWIWCCLRLNSDFQVQVLQREIRPWGHFEGKKVHRPRIRSDRILYILFFGTRRSYIGRSRRKRWRNFQP